MKNPPYSKGGTRRRHKQDKQQFKKSPIKYMVGLTHEVFSLCASTHRQGGEIKPTTHPPYDIAAIQRM